MEEKQVPLLDDDDYLEATAAALVSIGCKIKWSGLCLWIIEESAAFRKSTLKKAFKWSAKKGRYYMRASEYRPERKVSHA